jgi:hypothetical protein
MARETLTEAIGALGYQRSDQLVDGSGERLYGGLPRRTMFAPLVTVIGYETIGHRHMAIAVQRTVASG